jgi:hypothetical protein
MGTKISVMMAASTILVVIAAVGAWQLLSGAPASRAPESEASRAKADTAPGLYDDYASVLKTYVDDRGMANYRQMKADRQGLDAFVAWLASVDSRTYRGWSEKEKIAFWVNAYNGLTLRVIIDHYPIKKRGGLFGFRFPDNSIRQIPGAWDKLKFPVMGKQMTLDEIEHEVLRKEFNEPRIHLALVCAAMGCPPLRHEPYVGNRLDAQFDDQAGRFLQAPRKFRIDRAKKEVHLSSIFKWFGEDFVRNYGTDKAFAGHKDSERAVLSYISKHVGEQDRNYLVNERYKIKYLDYDWTLNEQ